MKSISTGVGLCVLSGLIATCLAAAHFGGEANALAIDLHTPSHDAITLTLANLPSGCSSQREAWFSPIPKQLNRCLQHYESNAFNQNRGGWIGTKPLGICDVNSDGVDEVFDLLGRSNLRAELPILIRSSTEFSGDGSTLLVHVPVLTNSMPTTEAILAMIGSGATLENVGNIHVTASGWRDLDADRDEDLVCNVIFTLPGGESTYGFDIWFENTGYTAAPPPNPYDLDGDGEVGAADISVLLLNYSK